MHTVSRLWLLPLALLAGWNGATAQSESPGATRRPEQLGIPSVKALGDAQVDLIYTPVTPCRVIDTRLAAAGPLAPGLNRSFFVAGGSGFPNQGGQSGGCGIPFGPATAVMFNFIAVAPAGDGNLRAWAWDNPMPPAPNASIINYGNVTIANGVAVPICPDGAPCSSDLVVRADVSGTHLVADVLGYFSRFPKEETKVVYAEAVFPQDTDLPGSFGCDTMTRIIGINVPGPGRVVVDANVQIDITHVNSSHTTVWAVLVPQATANPDCSAADGARFRLDSNAPSGPNYAVTLHPHYSQHVATAGAHFYTLAGLVLGGFGADAEVVNVFLQATFYPD